MIWRRRSIEGPGTEADRIEATARGVFLGRLPGDLLDEVLELARPAWYPARTVISPNQEGSGPAIVLSGSLRYFLTAPDGRQLTIRYVGAGGLVGSLSREPSRHPTAIEILEPSNLGHLDLGDLRGLAALRPELAAALLDEATGRLREAYRAIAARAFTTVRARVARDLVERASIAGPLQAGVHIDVTQQSLADATGSVREVVARAVRELRKDGTIAGEGEGITVLDPEALVRAAGM